MKRIATFALVVLVLLSVIGCGSSEAQSDSGAQSGSAAQSAPTVSDDDAKMAFMVGFIAIFSASMGLAFSQEVPGAVLDEETNDLTLTDFSLTDMTSEESGITYTAVSGTALSGEEEMIADLTLVGGPVQSIQFNLDSAKLQSETGFSQTVTVNGHKMDLEIGPEDFQG